MKTTKRLVDPTFLEASGGDTVKLFDVCAATGGGDQSSSSSSCVLSYGPSPGFPVYSLKWNHTSNQQENSFSLDLFERTLVETLDSFQKSIHGDTRNLHIEVLLQSHMNQKDMSRAMSLLLENQAKLRRELLKLRKENLQLGQLL